MDNTSSGTLVIVDPLWCNRVTLINLSYIPMLFYLNSIADKTMLSVPFERNFQKIAKINSQQEKPFLSNRKISSRKTQKIPNPQN